MLPMCSDLQTVDARPVVMELLIGLAMAMLVALLALL